LIISLQRLLERLNRNLQRLVAMPEIRYEIFCAGVISHTGGIAAAEIDDGGGKAELLRVAEHIAICPRRARTAAEITGVAGVESEGVAQALADSEGDGYAPRIIQLLAHLDTDLGKHIQRQQITTRPFNHRRFVRFAGVQQQPRSYQMLMNPLQSVEVNRTYVHLGS
jgi:hypothetical protein